MRQLTISYDRLIISADLISPSHHNRSSNVSKELWQFFQQWTPEVGISSLWFCVAANFDWHFSASKVKQTHNGLNQGQVLLNAILNKYCFWFRGSKGRSIWYFVHWLLGTAVSLLGIINIYTGLRAYHRKTSRSTRIWTIIFTAEISVIILFYLIQEKWDYIRRQGVILGHEPVQPTEQEISPRNKLKETVGEPC